MPQGGEIGAGLWMMEPTWSNWPRMEVITAAETRRAFAYPWVSFLGEASVFLLFDIQV